MAQNDTDLSENSEWEDVNGTIQHKTAKDKFGHPIVRYSQNDIFDRFGRKDIAKEDAANKRAAAVKTQGVTDSSPTGKLNTFMNNATDEQKKAFVSDASKAHPIAEQLTGATGAGVADDESKRKQKAAESFTSEASKGKEALSAEGKHLFDEVSGKGLGSGEDTSVGSYKGAADEIQRYKSVLDNVDDYYKDTLTGFYDEASNKDKKIYALDAALTTMKNIAAAKPYIGSIYGRSHEGTDMGTEKSLMEKAMEKSLDQGLDRRNKRMSAALDQQIKLANFPSDMKMRLYEINANNDLDYAQKKRLMNLELEKYGKTMSMDISKDKAIRENAAYAPHRASGSLSFGPLNFGVN